MLLLRAGTPVGPAAKELLALNRAIPRAQMINMAL